MGRWYPHVRVDQEYYWPRCAALVRQSDLASFSRGRGFVLVGTFEPLGANNNNVRACVRNREEELVWLHSLILSILDWTCVFALGSTVSCSLNTQEVDYKTVSCAVKCCSSQFPLCCRHYTSSYSCSQLHLCRGHSQTEKHCVVGTARLSAGTSFALIIIIATTQRTRSTATCSVHCHS